LETVDDFSIVIVSDAGAPFAIEEEAQEKFSRQALRTLDIATDQARGLRRRLLHSETVGWNRSQPSQPRVYALAAIDDDPNDTKRFTAMRALRADPGLVAPLARLRTRLNPFSEQEQDQLINWGWYLMDLAVRTHIAKTAPAPTEWLLPEAPLG
jgi:NTE family protein